MLTTRADRFTSAYREYGSRVLGYLRAHGVDDPEAVTQEVFLSLYARIDDVTGGEAGVRALVFTIAHARLVDHFRAIARRPILSPYVVEDDRRISESAEQRVMSASSDDTAVAMLDGLADDQREVIALRVIVGLSLAETGEVMGRSEGAIKQLQRRGLEHLRHRISVRNDHE